MGPVVGPMMGPKRSKLVRAILTGLAVSLIWDSPSQAQILLEPYLAYGFSDLQESYGPGAGSTLDGTTRRYTDSGVTLGGRVAYRYALIFFGLDYSIAPTNKASVKEDTTGTPAAGEISRSRLFAILGAGIPVIRGYVGYSLRNSLVAKLPAGDERLEGSAIKAGFSYTGLPLVIINIEYIASSFNKASLPGTSASVGAGGYFTDLRSNELLLSVSYPFEIGL